ncbi:hypothetical protein Lal_00027997 [Lupinus albus]|uniref:Putative gibberellin regulated protein n=1 Tax=Lupinus albus TaxID=3870 RepID=A0A6A4NLL1_LUPAL|nr:putative gibberellin regulated protein [Lupinus albus]KAF1859815.1 hypothetical protein Lal_00027997 [Lupinus albus]
MPFKSFLLLLLPIFLLVLTTKVSSYHEDLNIVPIVKPIPSTPIKAPPTPPSPPPVKPPATTPSPPPTTPSSPAQPPVVKPPVASAPTPAPIVKSNKDCIALCGYRCQLHSRKQICVRACVTCCDRCKCVPPGTYGNREKCGKCYTDMLTHGNRPKCP